MLKIRTAWDRPARPPDGVTEHVLLVGLTPQAGLAPLPGNLCILLDCSASMEGQKLEDAKAACRLAAQCLNPDDMLSLVTFNMRPTMRFTSERREALSDRALEDHLVGVKAEGTTCVDIALAEAEKALTSHLGPKSTSSILLITDGHPTDVKGNPLVEYGPFYSTAERLAAAGICLVTVGLGSAQNYNSAFLTAFADRGRGRFCYAPEGAELGALLRHQIHTAQATVMAGLEIILAPRMNGVRLNGFCRITPQYLPFDLPIPGSEGKWCISCGTLEAEVADAETTFLAMTETQGMFGMSSGSYPVVSVSASWRTNAGSRASAPESVVSLNYTPILREQQKVTAQVQQLRTRWEMGLYQDELSRTTDVNRTGQLLQQIVVGATGLGLVGIADQASAQLDHLRHTGQLDADNLARTGQLLRETGRFGPKGDRMNQNNMGIGFGGGGIAGTPSAQPDALKVTQPLVMGLAMLEVTKGRVPGTQIPLNKVRLVLGRNAPPNVTVDIDLTKQELGDTLMVSRRHAEFSWEEGCLFLRDLSSSNGTFINGERLTSSGQGQPSESRELHPGDVVRVANIELRIVRQ